MKTEEIVKNLQLYGFAIDKDVIPKEECKIMSEVLDEIEEKQYADGNLASKRDSQVVIDNVHIERPDIFLNKINIPSVMNTVSTIFNDTFVLSSFNASRSGSMGGGLPHIDARIPVSDFSSTAMMVAMLCVDDFKSTNGATIVWPFSHLSGKDVPNEIRESSEVPGGIYTTAPRGAVIYFVSQIWHAISPRIEDSKRWGVAASYSRWWVKSVYDFIHCGEDIFKKLSPQQKILFGFTTRPPYLWEKRRYTKTKIEDLPKNYNDVIRLG